MHLEEIQTKYVQEKFYHHDSIMHIVFITFDYPDFKRPVFTFVKNLVDAIADRGNECTVIAPYSITKNKRFHKEKDVYKTNNGISVTVYRPNYFSLSNLKFNGKEVSSILHKKAVNRILRKIKNKPNVVYGHFWNSAYEGYDYAKSNNIPLVVATGESEIPMSIVGTNFQDFYDYISHVICVSSKNKEESLQKGMTREDKCIVIPNAIDSSVFKRINKEKCRKELGIPLDSFVVISTGAFIHRKGTQRISNAIDQIKESIYSIFIGSGPEVPTCKNILFQGQVNNKEIPLYLNAADTFVLPTLKEGCCNAIVEAMACGLPIISSDLSFNHDILDESNSILIDPMDINAISEAISKLKKDIELRQNMSSESLKKAEGLTIAARAKKIEQVLKNSVNKS